MSENHYETLTGRYTPWRAYSPVQRHLLRIVSATIVVVILAITFDWARDVVVWPLTTVERWVYGPPPSPYGTSNLQPVEPVVGPGSLDVVLGAALAGLYVLVVISLMYFLGLMLLHAVKPWWPFRASNEVADSASTTSNGQPN